jgi:hypothetical protein
MFSNTKRLFKKLGKSKKAKNTSVTTADASPEVSASTSITIANMTDFTPTAQVNQAVEFTVSIQLRPSRSKLIIHYRRSGYPGTLCLSICPEGQ